jgi:HAE1 family hydrophobic/amphiphilic exporter-1
MVMRQPGSNTIEVNNAILRLFPIFRAQLPPSVQLRIRGDRARNIREAFKDIQFTMVLTLGLVIMVIFLFLRNVSATVIPAMALPFSILGTFAVMYVCGYSLDNLSMMALILCIGFVVDDAIVMLENIVRHMEHGEEPLQAALNGSKEIGFTIVSMTVSLAAVFIPVLFMGGILGRLFKEFAVTICAAILISGMVSVTLTPMLCSRFLKSHANRPHRSLDRLMEQFFKRLHSGYERSLRGVLNHRPVMLAVFVVVLCATVYLFNRVPKGFIPDTDQDQVSVTLEAAQGTSYYKMAQYQKRVSDIVARDPNVDTIMSSVGGNFGSSANQARIFLQLKPRKERALTAAQVIEELRPKVTRIAGYRVFMTLPPSIRIGGRMSKSAYEFTVQGPDTADLYSQSARL